MLITCIFNASAAPMMIMKTLRKPMLHGSMMKKCYPIMKETNRLGTFSYGGNIWHHLEFTNNWYYWKRTDDGIKESMLYGDVYDKLDRKVKRLVKTEDIIRRSGSWILTDMRTYKKALEKTVNVAKYEKFMKLKAKGEVEGFPMGLPKREINPTLFEVYIEKVE